MVSRGVSYQRYTETASKLATEIISFLKRNPQSKDRFYEYPHKNIVTFQYVLNARSVKNCYKVGSMQLRAASIDQIDV